MLWGGRGEKRKRNNIQIEFGVWQLCNKWKRKHNRVVRKMLDDSSQRHMHLWEKNYPFHYPLPYLLLQNPLIVWVSTSITTFSFDMSMRNIASAGDVRPGFSASHLDLMISKLYSNRLGKLLCAVVLWDFNKDFICIPFFQKIISMSSSSISTCAEFWTIYSIWTSSRELMHLRPLTKIFIVKAKFLGFKWKFSCLSEFNC